jgi:hypothetical protein
MQPYIYEPLPTARSVRLLKLHGDSEPPIRDDRIRCTLRVVSLDECPAYSAISYTWGDASVTHVIECDGKEIHTRPNLLRLLQEICRSKYRDHELWIDAICIYSYRTATKCCRNLRFRPQFCEGFESFCQCDDASCLIMLGRPKSFLSSHQHPSLHRRHTDLLEN